MTLATPPADRKPFFIPKEEFDELLARERRPLSRGTCGMLVFRRGTFTIQEIANEAKWLTGEVWEMLEVMAGYPDECSFSPSIDDRLTLCTRITVTVKGV